MDHVAGVKYAKDRYVVFGDRDDHGWVFGRCDDGTFEASGLCPVCLGVAYGPRIADVGSREKSKELVTDAIDVVCECHCGFDHGAGSDVGCGRWWIASSVGA